MILVIHALFIALIAKAKRFAPSVPNLIYFWIHSVGAQKESTILLRNV